MKPTLTRTPNPVRRGLLGQVLRTALVCTLLLTWVVPNTVQAQGLPCDCAERWTGGGHWNLDGTIDDSPNNPVSHGIIRCAASAETQSQVVPNGPGCVWNSAAAEAAGIELPVFTNSGPCFDPSDGFADFDANQVSLPIGLVEIVGPTNGQPIIWLNFDVRAFVSSFSFQINDNSGDNIGWALYESMSATSGVDLNTIAGDSLSGGMGNDPLPCVENLRLVGFESPVDGSIIYTEKWCGAESSNTWSTPTSPQSFDPLEPSNFYLLVWDQDADGDLAINNFKARFGCSDPTICFLEVGDETVECNGDDTYSVEVPIMGNNASYVGYDVNATPQSSAAVCLTNPDANTPVVQGTIVMTYPIGTAYNITISAQVDPEGCADPDNGVQCVANVIGEGPEIPTFDVDHTNVTCNGEADGTITVSNAPVGATITVDGALYNASAAYGPGTYTVEVAIANGCSGSEDVEIDEPIEVTLDADATNVSCYGEADGTITASASLGATITVDGAAYDAAAAYGPGDYEVCASAPGGNEGDEPCEVCETLTVDEPEVLGVTVTGDCYADNPGEGYADANVTGGTMPYDYLWNPGGEMTASIGNLASGSYSVVVTDENGCQAENSITLECFIDCNLRTYTQGGWGSKPRGNNPGSYVHGPAGTWANFNGAFPTGVLIGCDYTVLLTDPPAVTNFLPSGGTPSVLTQSWIDPVGSGPAGANQLTNTLAAQLTAATLSVGFDAWDPNFGESDYLLGNTYITGGVFMGMQVNELLEIANQFIGGCGGSYTASQLNTALTAINENYNGGGEGRGFLTCWPVDLEKIQSTVNEGADVLAAFPNPTRDMLTVRTLYSDAGQVTISLLDLSGRSVMAVDNFKAEAGDLRIHQLDISNMDSGIYLLNVVRDGHVMTERIVVTK